MKPIQKTVKDAGQLIAASPWAALMDKVRDISNGVVPPPGQYMSNHGQSLSGNSNFSTATTLTPTMSFSLPGQPTPTISLPNSSYSSYGGPVSSTGSSFGFTTPVPATPLSAALGPAAFSIVPTTPGQGPSSANSNGTLPVPGFSSIDLGGPPAPQSQLNWLARADALLQQQGTTVRRVDR
jgi:hypothetical protein